MRNTINTLSARVITDSRGDPTIEVTMSRGTLSATAAVPSGKSRGSREAVALRDKDGKGVRAAIGSVTGPIAKAVAHLPLDPEVIDKKLIALDGTQDKSRLGANALLAVSMAAVRLTALKQGVPLWNYIATATKSTPSYPKLYMNMLNGGAHADFCLPFQEYIVVVGGRAPREAYAKANAIFETLGELIKRKVGNVSLGDEGGYAPRLQGFEKPFELLIDASGDAAGVRLAIDVAATELFCDGRYILDGVPCDAAQLCEIYQGLIKKFELASIEDPFAEGDRDGWKKCAGHFGAKLDIVADDLTVTNPKLVAEAATTGLANALIVKPNQIGTMTEVFDAVRVARNAGWKIIVSHRSGETTDSFIADLAVGLGAYGIKAGAPTQKERRAKYERLIEIEKEMRGVSSIALTGAVSS